MKVLENYLKKHALYPAFIEDGVSTDLEISIVLPACNEKDIIKAIQSLANCIEPDYKVELIIVINASQSSSELIKHQNLITYQEIIDFKKDYNGFLSIYPILFNDLNAKHAGVGLARKIGMDEAIRRFHDINNSDGVIVCFDADCVVLPNYLIEIEKAFKNSKLAAASIYFEHPIEGNEYPSEIYQAIINYELHLRVYKNAIQWANLPYGMHTVGSSMAVRVLNYCQQGGMNKRKAGEDFYFLQKFIQNTKFEEINSTTVLPSPRISDRVPFGTGKAIGEIIERHQSNFYTYSLRSFQLLKELSNSVSLLYDEIELIKNLNPILLNFYGTDVWVRKLEEIKRESASKLTFIKRFYQWFDAF